MSNAKLLDGKATAAQIRKEVASFVQERIDSGRNPPGLAAILVGDNPASRVYVRNKQQACSDVGIKSWLHHLPADTTQRQLLDLITELNTNPEVHGILVQLPLPRQIDADDVLDAIDPTIDVDAFHPENLGLLVAGKPRFTPCTPTGCIELLRRYEIPTAGKEVVIVGRSNIVGKPLALMMMQKRSTANPYGCDSTVTLVHTQTRNMAEVCRRADILIAAAGEAGLIKAEMVKPGAVVLDVGINSVNDKLVGDVAPNVAEVASALSPVPGGIGPMTIALLMKNTLRAAELLDG
jgi:methylenetetrahydrofolate dehydrogenase (NADP+)/methenyltetrahydrofolate cyclohydrolase